MCLIDASGVTLLLAGLMLLACLWLLRASLRPARISRSAPLKPPSRRAVIGCLVLLLGYGGVVALFHVGEYFYTRGMDRQHARVQRLRAVFELLSEFQERFGHPPTSANDLYEYTKADPATVELIRQGEVIILWGRRADVGSENRVPMAVERLDGRTRVRVLWTDSSVTGTDAATAARWVAGELPLREGDGP
jgi:hypothetical protein